MFFMSNTQAVINVIHISKSFASGHWLVRQGERILEIIISTEPNL